MTADIPSLRRGGRLPRDKDGWDVGTVRQKDGRLLVRVHREFGDVDWGEMVPGENETFTFKSKHAETASSDGLAGDEGGLFAEVVKTAGGSLPWWDGR
jgi:hypothetical protein